MTRNTADEVIKVSASAVADIVPIGPLRIQTAGDNYPIYGPNTGPGSVFIPTVVIGTGFRTTGTIDADAGIYASARIRVHVGTDYETAIQTNIEDYGEGFGRLNLYSGLGQLVMEIDSIILPVSVTPIDQQLRVYYTIEWQRLALDHQYREEYTGILSNDHLGYVRNKLYCPIEGKIFGGNANYSAQETRPFG